MPAAETATEPPDRVFLISSNPADRTSFLPCHAATTITGYSMSLDRFVIVAVTCKRWGCTFCGPKKVHKLAHLADIAKPTTLLTLTIDPKLYDSPRTAYDKTRRPIGNLVKWIRKDYGEFEYMKVLEVTKKGWPHYHFVARCGYIPQSQLSTEWASLTGAKIVDIRKIKRTQDAYWYVVKYLAKQAYIPWTTRRVSTSKRFAPPQPQDDRPRLDLEEVERFNEHPYDWMRWRFEGYTFEKISPIVFAIVHPPREEKVCSVEASDQSPRASGEGGLVHSNRTNNSGPAIVGGSNVKP